MKLLNALLQRSPFERSELKALIATAPFRYKVYSIKKRDGKSMRTIAQPAPEVKFLQELTVKHFISKWPMHDSATAYKSGASLSNHVHPHIQSRFLLKVDFANFFPSIKADAVRAHAIRHSKFEEDDLLALINILCWRNKRTGEFALSIGAPSSPFVSNSIMFEFDALVTSICGHQGITYTRYADDLAFSTSQPEILIDLEKRIPQLLATLAYPRLSMNPNKTVNVSKQHRRSLVGLVITPDQKISLGRSRKRAIHAAIDRYTRQLLSVDEISKLRGTLAFAWSVEPSFVKTLAKKYGNETMSLLDLPFIAEEPGIERKI